MTKPPVPSTVTKTYDPRGPLQQFRFDEATAFECFRCGDTKKAKLITTYNGDWARRLCNGCYGYLLSIFEIKRGTAPDDESADALAAVLVRVVSEADRRRAEQLYRASETRAAHLTPEAVKFIATAEHVASKLEGDENLEWSPAVIGLCKAVEAEAVTRVLIPLAEQLRGVDLRLDKADKDIGRVAVFCADPSRKPPELGSLSHFIQTCVNSEQRRTTSPLLGGFMQLASSWKGSNWILDLSGLHASLTELTAQYRNRAAHIDELGADDYRSCRELVIGKEGMMWMLTLSTERPR